VAVEGRSEAGDGGCREVDYGQMADEIEALGRYFLEKYGASDSRRDGPPGGAGPAAIRKGQVYGLLQKKVSSG